MQVDSVVVRLGQAELKASWHNEANGDGLGK